MESTMASDGTVAPPTVPFTEEEVKGYLDKNIVYWRKCAPTEMRASYIDAYQSVRVSLFGELLPKGDE